MQKKRDIFKTICNDFVVRTIPHSPLATMKLNSLTVRSLILLAEPAAQLSSAYSKLARFYYPGIC